MKSATHATSQCIRHSYPRAGLFHSSNLCNAYVLPLRGALVGYISSPSHFHSGRIMTCSVCNYGMFQRFEHVFLCEIHSHTKTFESCLSIAANGEKILNRFWWTFALWPTYSDNCVTCNGTIITRFWCQMSATSRAFHNYLWVTFLKELPTSNLCAPFCTSLLRWVPPHGCTPYCRRLSHTGNSVRVRQWMASYCARIWPWWAATRRRNGHVRKNKVFLTRFGMIVWK